MGNLKTGSFMDGPKEMTVLSMKQSIFVDGSREMAVLTKKETPRKGCLCNILHNKSFTVKRRFSAASSASARCSQNIKAAGTPDPSKASGRCAPNRGCLSEAKTGVKIVAKKKPGGKPGEFFACYKRNKLFVKCSSNVNGASYSTTYHRVVTDSEESHHLNVCWN